MGKGEKVDFGVAVDGAPAEKEKGRGRGRPVKMPWDKKPVPRSAGQGSAKKKPAAGKEAGKGTRPAVSITNNNLENNNVVICSEEFKELFKNDNPEIKAARALGEQLTAKELKFLEIYLSGDGDRIKLNEISGL